MRTRTFLLALMAIFALCACDDTQQYVGKWESEKLNEDGVKGKMFLTLNEDGTMLTTIDASATVEEEGINTNAVVSASMNGTWEVVAGILTLTYDEKSLSTELKDLSSDDPDADAIIQMVMEDESMKKEVEADFETGLKSEMTSGDLNVKEIDGSKMVLEDEDGTMTFYKR